MGMDDDGLPGARIVVVKQGAQPVLLRGAVQTEVAVPAVRDAIDTTGAGDALAGGFLFATRHLSTRYAPVWPRRRASCAGSAPTDG